ncbi:MAG TPA: hypothetical protein VK826_09000 [Bacteroidia bacterium]|nr:hypothetical protein [Bacteroidia bacterium]
MVQAAVTAATAYRAHKSKADSEAVPPNNGQAQNSGSGNFRAYVLWGIIGSAAIATAGYFGYKALRNVVSNQAGKHSLEAGTPAYYAQSIRMGIENNNWSGTDTAKIREVFIEIPDKYTFRKVEDNYKLQYGVMLFDDLMEHLKTTEMDEMKAIYRVKPERADKNSQPTYDPYAWAIRVHSAVHYETWGLMWGTDLEAIKQVIREIPNQQSWDDLEAAYQSKYSASITEEIDGDVSSWDYDFRDQLSKKGITV